MTELVPNMFERLGLGRVGSNSHPLHPATVHIPIAFFTIANILKVLYGITIFLPAISPFKKDMENTSTLAILGYFLNVIGILGSVPAVLTGSAELYTMIQFRGLFIENEKSGSTALEPIVKIALTHALLNDVVIVGAVYNWLMERHRPHEDYNPHTHQIFLSAGALALTAYAAYLGGDLIYTHGVGVQRMEPGAEKKTK